MRGPLHALLNTRLFGTYLRVRFGVALALVLVTVGAILALEIGGFWGILVLSGLAFSGLIAFAAVLSVR